MIPLLVFIGGGLGSLARFGVSKLLPEYNSTFPIATLAANGLSCLVLGIVLSTSLKTQNPPAYFFLATGFCGGFSTYSTFSAETLQLYQNGYALQAALNIIINLIVCLGCIAAGSRMGL